MNPVGSQVGPAGLECFVVGILEVSKRYARTAFLRDRDLAVVAT
jgi:hypothetical protein